MNHLAVIGVQKVEIGSIEKVEATFHIVETDLKDFPTFHRSQSGNWSRVMGDSLEEWDSQLEEAFQKYQNDHPAESEKIRILDERRLAELEVLLDLIPECPIHGRCIPYAKEWIDRMKTNSNHKAESVPAISTHLETDSFGKILLVDTILIESIQVVHTDKGLFRRINGVWEKFAGNGYIEQWGANITIEEKFNQYMKARVE